jgi:hypothetical protein
MMGKYKHRQPYREYWLPVSQGRTEKIFNTYTSIFCQENIVRS